jgi:hypothetical protein
LGSKLVNKRIQSSATSTTSTPAICSTLHTDRQGAPKIPTAQLFPQSSKYSCKGSGVYWNLGFQMNLPVGIVLGEKQQYVGHLRKVCLVAIPAKVAEKKCMTERGSMDTTWGPQMPASELC